MIYLITLEELENRYTTQWKKWIKESFEKQDIITYEITGNKKTILNDSGTFLNWAETNIWKSEQITKIAELFQKNLVKENDIFLFYDAWHYGAIAIKYMSALQNIPVKIFGVWHAGSYDEYDLLAQRKLDKYFYDFEASLFKIYDKSFVATKYHLQLINSKNFKNNCQQVPFPFKFKDLDKYVIPKTIKEDIIAFPHRISSEKQVKIAKIIEKEMSSYNIRFEFYQEQNLSKEEYYSKLAKAKIVFSANLQETWGIGVFEGVYLGCLPVVPNRLSYREMYPSIFKYPSNWTKSENQFKKKKIVNYLLDKFKNFDSYSKKLENIILSLKEKYCNIEELIEVIKKEVQ